MRSTSCSRSFSKTFLIILSISEIGLSFQYALPSRIAKHNQITKYVNGAGLFIDYQQELLRRKGTFSFAVSASKDTPSRSFFYPIYRRLKWFATLISHIIQLIVRSFESMDKDLKKKSDDDFVIKDVSRDVEDIVVKLPDAISDEIEDMQSSPSAEPEPQVTQIYVPHQERKEADKSYAERKLQEIETLQIEAQSNRLARKAQVEKDGRWAQSSLNNNEKKVATQRESESAQKNDETDHESDEKTDVDSSSDDDEDGPSSPIENANFKIVGKQERKTIEMSGIFEKKKAVKIASTYKDKAGSSTDIEIKELSTSSNMKASQGNEQKSSLTIPSSGYNKPSQISSKPNLNVILKKSLKDSLYSINVDGYYSNNGSAAITNENKISALNPLVRNSLLLSEKVEQEKKISATKNLDLTTLDIMSDYPKTQLTEEEEIQKAETYAQEYIVNEIELLKNKTEDAGILPPEGSLSENTIGLSINADNDGDVTDGNEEVKEIESSDSESLEVEVEGTPTDDVSPHNSYARTDPSVSVSYLLPPVPLEMDSSDTPGLSPPSSFSDVPQGEALSMAEVLDMARELEEEGEEEEYKGEENGEEEEMALAEKGDMAPDEDVEVEDGVVAIAAQVLDDENDVEGEVEEVEVEGTEEEEEEYKEEYGDESIERILQSQQADEYNGEFPNPPSSESTPTPAPTFSSFQPYSSPMNPSTVPLCLLGAWELAEQRYLSPDRTALSDFYMDVISVPSFGTLSSSLSGSKGMEWGAKRRVVERDAEAPIILEGGNNMGGKIDSGDHEREEEFEVEFNVIRGCSSTEWMKGQGRHEKTITARIIKPPKEAYEQRPTLCTYTGVLALLSARTIRGYVYSTAITVEGEKQLVGVFEMNKMG